MRRDWERMRRDWERDCYVIATPQSMGIIQALDKNSLPTKDNWFTSLDLTTEEFACNVRRS